MTLRPPRWSSSSRTAPIAALDYEIVQEQVSALGRMGRALEAALAALADHERAGGGGAGGAGGDGAARARLVQDASDALWCFMVQREAMGLRDPRQVLRDYRVPAEVHSRMGVFGRR
jgi:plasmid stabilization system protein ParE